MMGRTKRTPPSSPFLMGFESGSSGTGGASAKRKPTSPAKEEDRVTKLTIIDSDQVLSQEQKVDKILAKLLDLERRWEDSGALREVAMKVEKVDEELERLRKEQIAANVIIVGVPEKKQEKYQDLEQAVEKVLSALDLGNIDFSQIRRLGKADGTKNRSIQVKFVRQKDRVRVLLAKKKLREVQELKDIYINAELTQLDMVREQKLRETARDWKKTNPGLNLKYYIKKGRLVVIRNRKVEEYRVNEDGDVEPINEGQEIDQD